MNNNILHKRRQRAKQGAIDLTFKLKQLTKHFATDEHNAVVLTHSQNLFVQVYSFNRREQQCVINVPISLSLHCRKIWLGCRYRTYTKSRVQILKLELWFLFFCVVCKLERWNRQQVHHLLVVFILLANVYRIMCIFKYTIAHEMRVHW